MCFWCSNTRIATNRVTSFSYLKPFDQHAVIIVNLSMPPTLSSASHQHPEEQRTHTASAEGTVGEKLLRCQANIDTRVTLIAPVALVSHLSSRLWARIMLLPISAYSDTEKSILADRCGGRRVLARYYRAPFELPG